MEEWARQITEIVPVQGLGNSPARVNPRTGVCYINAETWDSIPKAHRLFILLHENAHLQAQTDDELLVDEIAFNHYAFAGYPLSEAVLALSRQLDFTNPEHHHRLILQDQRARKYDYYINGNKKALLNNKKMDKVTNRIRSAHSYEGASYPYEDFFGKKARDRRKARRQARHERKLEKIEARGTARATVAQAGGGLAGLKQGFGSLVTSLFGGGAYAPEYDQPPPPEPQSDNTVWIVIAVVVVIAVVSYVIWKKKKGGK